MGVDPFSQTVETLSGPTDPKVTIREPKSKQHREGKGYKPLTAIVVLLLFLAFPVHALSPAHDRETIQMQRFSRWAHRASHRPQANAYRMTGALFRDLQRHVAERPGIVRPVLLGHSLQRRPIWGFRVSRPGESTHTKVLVFAGIHALEWISTETATVFLEQLVTLPPKGVEVIVVPLLNPDGREKVERDLLAGRTVYRRGNAANVDLNRDFAVNRDARAVWKHVIPRYYSSTQSALSQPESRSLDRLLAAEKFDVAISLHAFGGFVYTPWAGLWKRPEDWKTHHHLGTVMSQAQGAHGYKVRQLSRWGFFFRAHGAEIDHIYGQYGTLAFLVELTRSGLNPFRPSTFKSPFNWYNPKDPKRHTNKGVSALRALVYTLSMSGGVPRDN